MRNSLSIPVVVLAVCLLACTAAPGMAQDSLYHAKTPACATDGTHRLSLKEILIPAALVGVSAIYVGNGWTGRQRRHVQQALSAHGGKRLEMDNYTQYAPMVAAYGLDFCGVKGRHSLKDKTIILAMSYATMGIVVNAMKYTVREKRPGSSSRNSFPSGHTATAFMGAEFLYQEYKDVSPWIGYAGYAVAAATGYLRIYNNRHWINDVVAGGCIGILSTKFAYWLYPRWFKRAECNTGKAVVTGLPYYNGESYGVSLSATF